MLESPENMPVLLDEIHELRDGRRGQITLAGRSTASATQSMLSTPPVRRMAWRA